MARSTGPTKWDTREPCASCPYRIDAPLRLWSPEEFRDLLKHDADPLNGAIYGCHGTGKLPVPSVCGGWLLDQKRRGVPSIRLRLALATTAAARDALEAITDGGHKMFKSIKAMCRANGVRPTKPVR